MIVISMRMTRHVYPGGSEEKRDALAHDWWRFLHTALPGVPVLPMPNIGGRAVALLHELPIRCLVLSGGDDWGVFPERDATERELVLWAERMSIPVLGVCRGAQVLNRIRGGRIRSGFDESHVGTHHSIRVEACPHGHWPPELEVNSYHACGISAEDLAPGLNAWATAEDGSVEAFSSPDGKQVGNLWHPERETVAREHDMHLFQHLNRVAS